MECLEPSNVASTSPNDSAAVPVGSAAVAPFRGDTSVDVPRILSDTVRVVHCTERSGVLGVEMKTLPVNARSLNSKTHTGYAHERLVSTYRPSARDRERTGTAAMTAALGVTFCVKVGEFQNRTTQNSGVCEGVQGPSAVFNLHLCVRRSGVLGVE